jgi:hypothetical protein
MATGTLLILTVSSIGQSTRTTLAVTSPRFAAEHSTASSSGTMNVYSICHAMVTGTILIPTVSSIGQSTRTTLVVTSPRFAAEPSTAAFSGLIWQRESW